MKTYCYSHNGGEESVSHPEKQEVLRSLEHCDIPIAHHNGPLIRNHIMSDLIENGWSGEVKISIESKISIASQKNKIGLGVQTAGNMARMYADLMKLQKLQLDDILTAGILILPTVNAAKQLGENLANSDRLQSELTIFKKVIFMPILVIAFE